MRHLTIYDQREGLFYGWIVFVTFKRLTFYVITGTQTVRGFGQKVKGCIKNFKDGKNTT